MDAFLTMEDTTAGFLRKCCPKLVLGVIKLTPDPDMEVEEGADEDLEEEEEEDVTPL